MCGSFGSIHLPSVAAPSRVCASWYMRVWLPVREGHGGLTAAQFVCVHVPTRGQDEGRRGSDTQVMAI